MKRKAQFEEKLQLALAEQELHYKGLLEDKKEFISDTLDRAAGAVKELSQAKRAAAA